MDPKHKQIVYPAVTSFDYDDPFPDNHIMQGTREDARYVAIEEALDFYAWIGGIVSTSRAFDPFLLNKHEFGDCD